MKTVRNIGDINILKSYLLIWSERDCYIDGYREIRTSISDDFSGIETNSHRGDLPKRLDHALAQLDREVEHLQQNKPNLNRVDLERRFQYTTLKKTLLEVDREAL